ncbi:hypothetical protein MMC07_006448 [Pseudocyphellaria aurata]|nr:hypothetical protein [Pseudocyphellaria aurata]
MMNSYIRESIISSHAHLVASPKTSDLVASPKPSENGTNGEASGPPSPTTGPVINFAQVAPGIYRSSFPTAGNFEHLQSLGLKTILTLVPEEYPLPNRQFMKLNGIRHFQVPIPAHKDASVVIPLQSIAEAVKILLDPSQHPVLIHCNKGKHRTGCIVACYRKMHKWTIGAILTEYRKYAGDKFRVLDEKFMEEFDEQAMLDMVKAAML